MLDATEIEIQGTQHGDCMRRMKTVYLLSAVMRWLHQQVMDPSDRETGESPLHRRRARKKPC